jgi:PIN domain nuclease of toxin-antitoxin system
MTDWILDASAVLAFVQKEPGFERVGPKLAQATISSVNLSEVVAKLIDKGASMIEAEAMVVDLGLTVSPVDEDLGVTAGILRAATRRLGLSLGDRICLALAMRERRPVLTADRAWDALDFVSVTLIR